MADVRHMDRTDSPSRRRVVVVTGASAGIGRAIAQEFGRNGWRVALLARGEDGLQAARAEVDYLLGRLARRDSRAAF